MNGPVIRPSYFLKSIFSFIILYPEDKDKLNGTPGLTERVCKIEPHLFPYTI